MVARYSFKYTKKQSEKKFESGGFLLEQADNKDLKHKIYIEQFIQR